MSKLTPDQRRSIWRERLDRFQSMQLTVAEFCKREGVSTPSFYAWKKRLAMDRSNVPTSKHAATTSAKFVPLVVAGAQLPIRMTLPGGAAVELPIDQPEQTVQLMIAAIKATQRHHTAGEVA